MGKIHCAVYFCGLVGIAILQHLMDLNDAVRTLVPLNPVVSQDEANSWHTSGQMAAQLEQLLAEAARETEQQSTSTVSDLGNDAFVLQNLGTQLDSLIKNEALVINTNWSQVEDRLTLSFPYRDLSYVLQVFHCYRDYRQNLALQLRQPNSQSISHDQLRYDLRITYFGKHLANTLYATEHPMLVQMGLIDDTHTAEPATHPLCALNGEFL